MNRVFPAMSFTMTVYKECVSFSMYAKKLSFCNPTILTTESEKTFVNKRGERIDTESVRSLNKSS